MPANSTWDLIRGLKGNEIFSPMNGKNLGQILLELRLKSSVTLRCVDSCAVPSVSKELVLLSSGPNSLRKLSMRITI